MASAVDPIHPSHPLAIHPLHAVVLAGTVPLFLGALLADLAYWSSAQIQWSNFASWLLVGGLVLGAVALLCALVGPRRADRRRGRGIVFPLALSAAWVLGLFDALVHARDAWAIMPTALVLSTLATLLAGVATWIGFAPPRARAEA